jgi:hypothetical protein
MGLRPKIAAIVIGAAGGLAALSGGVAFATTQPGAAPAVPASTVAHTVSSTSVSQGTETPEPAGAAEAEQPSDGPGGHADPAGANVDHQFNGNE